MGENVFLVPFILLPVGSRDTLVWMTAVGVGLVCSLDVMVCLLQIPMSRQRNVWPHVTNVDRHILVTLCSQKIVRPVKMMTLMMLFHHRSGYPHFLSIFCFPFFRELIVGVVI